MTILQRDEKNTFNAVKISIIAVISLIIVTAFAFSAAVISYANVYPNVVLCGTSLGRMTREQATSTATQIFQESSNSKKITIMYQGKTFDLDITSNFSANIPATVDKAFSIGRNGDVIRRFADILSKKEITFAITQDDASINSQIAAFAELIEKDNKIFELSPKLDVIKVDLSQNGVIVDIDATHLAILQNLENMSFKPVEAKIHTVFDASSVDLLYKRIQRDPANATCTIIDNKPVIEPHKVGVSLDKNLLAQHLANGEKTFELPITTTMPKITTDQFQAKMFADVLGEKTTTYNSALTERTQNVMLASQGVNGVIIAPGRDFSFNQVVGERTYERGFKDATVFVNGKTEQGAGGGICQVSSTLYTAQLYADLQTIKRANHQFTVAYMPSGQDATVAYGVQDYVFRNNTAYPIKIISIMGGGKLTVKILGTKTDKDVKISIVNNTISTRDFEEKTEVSPDVSFGKTVVKQKGQAGATVDTYKVYLRNGVEEKRVFLHRSVYNPMERLIQISGVSPPTQESPIPQTPIEAPANSTPEPTASAKPTEILVPKETPSPSSVPTSETGL